MKLKNRDIVLTLTALRAIPPLKKAPKGTYGLAKNLAILTDAMKPIEEANRSLFVEHFGTVQTVEPTHPKFAEYQAAAKKIDDEETELALHCITQADLNLSENELDHEHLAAIRFIISDW